MIAICFKSVIEGRMGKVAVEWNNCSVRDGKPAKTSFCLHFSHITTSGNLQIKLNFAMVD